MERRLETETENHCKALDQLRDERESRYVGLSLLFKMAHPRDYASKLLAREETEATRQQQRAIERDKRWTKRGGERGGETRRKRRVDITHAR